MSGRPTIQRLIEFHELLNSLAEVERIIHLKRQGQITLESDTEHSYNLAMMAWFLAESFPELDRHKVITYALVHDLVEVHAGDTFVFAEQAVLDSKKDREAAAQQKLQADWADFRQLHSAIAAYEALDTPEARFVYALDKLIPVITVYLHEGLTWHEKKIKLQQLDADKKQKMSVSAEIYPYWKELREILLNQPELFPVS